MRAERGSIERRNKGRKERCGRASRTELLPTALPRRPHLALHGRQHIRSSAQAQIASLPWAFQTSSMGIRCSAMCDTQVWQAGKQYRILRYKNTPCELHRTSSLSPNCCSNSYYASLCPFSTVVLHTTVLPLRCAHDKLLQTPQTGSPRDDKRQGEAENEGGLGQTEPQGD